ncbi:MAG: adenylosuccinate synthase [Acidobacteriota bacterium]
MAHTIVLGMQWGDEGKGKIVDLISPAFDAVVRFQGGHNAGHTVKFADRHFALHFLPSGIVHDRIQCLLGNGMVLYPQALFDEIAEVEGAGIKIGDRLLVSDRAQVILPLHAALDGAREAARGEAKIGTTVRGIGPAYETKAARLGVRVGDLAADDLPQRLERLIAWVRPQLAALGVEDDLEVAREVERCRGWAERLAPRVVDGSLTIARWGEAGRGVLFEGAQGTLLDIDHGTYPFVTSSNCTAGGVATGAGLAPTRIDGVLGVIKAYVTRVGAGPFVSELDGAVADHLRARGNEFGTTTGRPRRCGWFDCVAARYARRINGIDALAITKLDVLDEVEEIALCVAYDVDGERVEEFPSSLDVLRRARPIYETVEGWQTSTDGTLDLSELPDKARAYLDRLATEVGAPIGLVSSGPRREETVVLDSTEMRHLLGDRLDAVLAHRDG